MESNRNMQCWNYNNCGHGKDLLCPVADQKAGRSCWLVTKTLCGGKVHGMQATRTKLCEGCGFYIYSHVLHSSPSPADRPGDETRRVSVLRSNLPR